MGVTKRYSLFYAKKQSILYIYKNSCKMNKLSVVLETIWVILAVVCLGMGIYATSKAGLEQSYMFFLLSVLALLMFFARRRKRLSNGK
ncbi:hypothetical protein DSECCO2_126820 [anaerobic digester metagenome]